MKLYELTGQYMSLMEMMDDPDIDQQIVQDTLEALDGEYEEKLQNCGKAIKNIQASQCMLDNEIKRLQARKKSAEKNEERLKTYIKNSMLASNKQTVKTEMFTFSVKEPALSVFIDDIDEVPKAFRTPVPDKIDKEGIKKLLKEGKSLSYAHLEPGNYSLLIR